MMVPGQQRILNGSPAHMVSPFKPLMTCGVVISSYFYFSPAVKRQNCSFFDKSVKLGRVTNLFTKKLAAIN